jgi:hypothetical protein
MLIRPATLADRGAILEFVLEEAKRYPLRPDLAKIKAVITEATSSARHFVWVAERNGKVEGVLAGLTSDNLWAQRQNCNISLWVSRIPGAGASLLREFLAWVKSRRGIKVAGMCPDLELDPRILALAERIGFSRHGGALLFYN